jgi:hypothetical protein
MPTDDSSNPAAQFAPTPPAHFVQRRERIELTKGAMRELEGALGSPTRTRRRGSSPTKHPTSGPSPSEPRRAPPLPTEDAARAPRDYRTRTDRCPGGIAIGLVDIDEVVFGQGTLEPVLHGGKASIVST